jgi:hypothetical protein
MGIITIGIKRENNLAHLNWNTNSGEIDPIVKKIFGNELPPAILPINQFGIKNTFSLYGLGYEVGSPQRELLASCGLAHKTLLETSKQRPISSEYRLRVKVSGNPRMGAVIDGKTGTYKHRSSRGNFLA